MITDEHGNAADGLTASVRTDRPERPALDAARIPSSLREIHQWVCWRYELRDAKWTKVPIDAATGLRASSTDRATWCSFERAQRAFEADESLDGLGFVFAEDDEFAGVDLDGCIDEQGRIAPSAQAVIEALGSYTEVSPSGRGVKVFLRGTKPQGAGCKSKAIEGYKETEVYDRARFFTVTGVRLEDTQAEVIDRQEELDALCAMLWPEPKREARGALGAGGGFAGDDEALIEKARRASNGVRFSALWDGDTSHHGGDDSAADLALCNMLAFWTGRDAERMDRLFRGSGLIRPKWDERRGATTYGLMTIEKAIEGCREVYVRGKMEQPHAALRDDKDHQCIAQSEVPLEERSRLRTDIGNAARLVKRHGQDIRHCFPMNGWFIWDGTRWRPDDRGHITELCKETALSITEESRAATQAEEQSAISQWARTSQKRERLKAMCDLAASEVPVTPDELDRDVWLFNCQNGTIDLRTGELRPHCRDELITKISPVEFDPRAECPRFERFLLEVFGGDPELIEYVLRWHGYCLTGDIREQYLLIYHGEGGNGKSVLLDTIADIMGDYTCAAAPHLLTVRKNAEHPTEIADLLGRRLVVASETEDSDALRMQLVKQMTGNAKLKGRKMRQDYFDFERTNKLILVTNNLPTVNEDTEGAWRRLRLVPFDRVIPEAERDKRLIEALRSERAGILARLVRACLDWQRNGLTEPHSVVHATSVYKGSANSFARFVQERCEIGTHLQCPASELNREYDRWSKELGLPQIRGKSIGKQLKALGCTSGKHLGARTWNGIGLRRESLDGMDGMDTSFGMTESLEKVGAQ